MMALGKYSILRYVDPSCFIKNEGVKTISIMAFWT